MNSILLVSLAGVLATVSMAGALLLITRLGLVDANMMRALGSLVTRRDDKSSTLLGFALHITIGIVFALFYAGIWSQFGFAARSDFVKVGLICGFAHGLVVSIILVIFVAEHHPVARFRKAGPGVGVAHFAVHLVYGLVLGSAVGFFQAKYDTVNELAGLVNARQPIMALRDSPDNQR